MFSYRCRYKRLWQESFLVVVFSRPSIIFMSPQDQLTLIYGQSVKVSRNLSCLLEWCKFEKNFFKSWFLLFFSIFLFLWIQFKKCRRSVIVRWSESVSFVWLLIYTKRLLWSFEDVAVICNLGDEVDFPEDAKVDLHTWSIVAESGEGKGSLRGREEKTINKCEIGEYRLVKNHRTNDDSWLLF